MYFASLTKITRGMGLKLGIPVILKEFSHWQNPRLMGYAQRLLFISEKSKRKLLFELEKTESIKLKNFQNVMD